MYDKYTFFPSLLPHVQFLLFFESLLFEDSKVSKFITNYYYLFVVDANDRHESESAVQQPCCDEINTSYSSNNGIVNGNQIVVEVETNIPVYKTNGMLPNS